MTLREMRVEASKSKDYFPAMEKLLVKEGLRAVDKHGRDYALLVGFAKILEESRGCDTPAEEFISGLVLSHLRRAITPADAEHELKTFKEDFESLIANVQKVVVDYPKELADVA